MSKKTPTPTMDDLVSIYMDNLPTMVGARDENLELEVKFGTRGFRKITHIHYNNVVQRLLASGFVLEPTKSILRIFNEYLDIKTGATRLSNIRTEINGIGSISKYCRTNEIGEDPHFEQKLYYKSGSKIIYPVERRRV